MTRNGYSRSSESTDDGRETREGYSETGVAGLLDGLTGMFKKEAPNSLDGSTAHIGSSRSHIIQMIKSESGELKFLRDHVGKIFSKQHGVGPHVLNKFKHLEEFIEKDIEKEVMEYLGEGEGLGTFEDQEGNQHHRIKRKNKRTGFARILHLEEKRLF